MHWYGFHNAYGNGSRMDGERVGRVRVFDSRRERDAWVEADVFDGVFHREAITSAEARRLMLRDLRPWRDVDGMGPDALAEAYEEMR